MTMLSDLFPVSLSGVTLTNNHLASSSDISFVVLRRCGYFKASRKFALFVYLLILSVELLCLLYAIRVCLKITSTCHFFFLFSIYFRLVCSQRANGWMWEYGFFSSLSWVVSYFDYELSPRFLKRLQLNNDGGAFWWSLYIDT